MRLLGVLFLVLFPGVLAFAQTQPAAEPGRWAFAPAPDDFRDDALLDLRYLNEREAGESGFIRFDENGNFLLGSGRPVRFWAVNTTVEREKPFRPRPRWPQQEPSLDRHARFLAKRGVNMVRLHAFLNPPTTAASVDAINEADRDWIWRTVAAVKKHGIYVTISPYWANNMRFNAGWGIPGDASLDAHGLLFFDATMQNAYKKWLRALFAEKNPYTGIPLAEDPAVAVIQLQNEDSLLFWTVNNLKNPQRAEFARRYAEWVLAKYGSYEAAFQAWSNNRVQGDNIAEGILEFHNLWEMTQNRTGGFAKRLNDQLQFWSETMYLFYGRTADYLRRELGCKQLINAGNWKTGDVVRLEDIERWAYTALDVQATNRYYSGIHNGPNRGWAIINGDEFNSPSILKNPLEFPLNLKQPRGYPMMVTESTWVMPMAYSTEGPFLVAAYQSLTGIDGFFWFNTGDEQWTPPQSANGFLPSQMKWMFGSPDLLGTFPGAALLYRMGYVREGDPAVLEVRAMEDLWARRTPVIAESASFDPNRDAGDIAPSSGIRTGVSGQAFLAGPVQTVFGADPAMSFTADLSQLIRGKVTDSVTGELRLDSEKAYCTLNAPKAQGVTAFFENQNEFRLTDVVIRSENEYGAVLVVSMDDRPLAESRKVLVQVGTRSRPTGWEERPKEITIAGGEKRAGFEVVNYGGAPWQVHRAKVEVTVRNAGLRKGSVLDMNGNVRGSVEVRREGQSLRFAFPEDAMYVVLE